MRMDAPSIDQPPQSAAAPLFAQQTNNCSKLCPMGVAVTSVRRSDRMHRFADSGRRGYRFALFSDAQGTPSLRIRVGQRGQGTSDYANKCSASRIRRRSRQHRAQASALRGPRNDRLQRWLTPVVIDRTRRGTHDRADADGPCRGCATAVSCRAASRTSRRACPCPVLLCICTSVAQT